MTLRKFHGFFLIMWHILFQLMDFILHFIHLSLQDSDENIFSSWNFNRSSTLRKATLYNQNNVSEGPHLLRPLHQIPKEYWKDILSICLQDLPNLLFQRNNSMDMRCFLYLIFCDNMHRYHTQNTWCIQHAYEASSKITENQSFAQFW